MKFNRSHLVGSALVLATAATVYGQEKPATTEAKTADAANTAAATPAKSPAPVRFEGTELHIGDLPPVAFHGFLSQGFLGSSKYDYLGDTTRGSFRFTEMGVNASMNPFPHTRVAIQGFAFSVGNVGEYDPALDYALVDYNFCDELGIRAGRIRRPEGIYNSIQDIDLARTWVLLPQGMYDARYRDFSGSIDGGSLYGNFNLKKAGGLSYEAYGGMVNLADNGGIARYLESVIPVPPIVSYRGVNGFPEAGIQLWWNTPVTGLRAGVNVDNAFGFSYDYRVEPPFGPGNIRGWTDAFKVHYSLEYQWKALTFQAEYKPQIYHNQATTAGNVISRSANHNDTWYAGLAYQIDPRVQVGAYYTEFYNNTADRDGSKTAVPSDQYQKDFAVAIRFDVKPWWIVKVEGHNIRGTALLHDNQDNPARNGSPWYMLAVKTTFSF